VLLLLALGGAGVLWLCAGLAFRWSAALVAGIAFLGAEQAVRLATGRSSVDPWTPAYAAALLLVAELAWWSIEPRVPAWSQPEAVLLRLLTVAGACAGAGLLAVVVVLAAGAPLEGGVGLELVGVAAAAASVGIVAAVARRPSATGRD
jgi:hypothetical protein